MNYHKPDTHQILAALLTRWRSRVRHPVKVTGAMDELDFSHRTYHSIQFHRYWGKGQTERVASLLVVDQYLTLTRRLQLSRRPGPNHSYELADPRCVDQLEARLRELGLLPPEREQPCPN